MVSRGDVVVIQTGIQNPPDRKWLLGWIAGMSVVVAVALIFFAADGKWMPLLVGVVIATAFVVGIWHREYYSRPSSFDIVQGGLVAHFRYKPALFVPWSQVAWMSVPPRVMPENRFSQDGTLHLQGRLFYPVFWSASVAIREAYMEQNGNYPLSNEEFEKRNPTTHK